MKLPRRAQACLVVASACLTLSACSESPTDESQHSGTETEPDRAAEEAAIEAYYPRLADCMTGQGFPATWDPISGSMTVEGDMDSGMEVELTCQEEIGPAPTPAPMTESERDRLYDATLEQYHCLLDKGYTPPGGEPPTREQWIAEYDSGTAWQPTTDQTTGIDFPVPACPAPGLSDLPPIAP